MTPSAHYSLISIHKPAIMPKVDLSPITLSLVAIYDPVSNDAPAPRDVRISIRTLYVYVITL